MRWSSSPKSQVMEQKEMASSYMGDVWILEKISSLEELLSSGAGFQGSSGGTIPGGMAPQLFVFLVNGNVL